VHGYTLIPLQKARQALKRESKATIGNGYETSRPISLLVCIRATKFENYNDNLYVIRIREYNITMDIVSTIGLIEV